MDKDKKKVSTIEDNAEIAIDHLIELRIDTNHIRALQDLLYNYRAFKISYEILEKVNEAKGNSEVDILTKQIEV